MIQFGGKMINKLENLQYQNMDTSSEQQNTALLDKQAKQFGFGEYNDKVGEMNKSGDQEEKPEQNSFYQLP